MKQILLFSLLLFATSNNFAQITIEENKIWTVLESGTLGPPNFSTTAIKFSGDTTFNNVAYKKMYASNDSSLMSNWITTTNFLREDSLHRIYRYAGDTEELLYDFSLEEGDTFHVNFDFPFCLLKVHNIDSIELNNGEKRKRISLIYSEESNPEQPLWGYIYWIQGIGSLTSLTLTHCWQIDNPYSLLCYMENDEVLYTSSSSNACFITPVQELELPDFKIYPNPTSGIVHIETEAHIEHLSIYDLNGKEMPIKFYNSSIDLSCYNAGVYLLKATVDGRQVVRKLVVKM